MDKSNLLVWRIADYTPEKYNPALDSSYTNWAQYVGVMQRLAAGKMLQTAATTQRLNLRKRPGAWYFHFIEAGVIAEHISGFSQSGYNVALRMPIAFMDEVFTTKEIAQQAEDGSPLPSITVDVLVKDHFRTRSNATECMVDFTDEDFDFLYQHILFEETFAKNILANQDYKDAISEGGDFYVVPVELEEE